MEKMDLKFCFIYINSERMSQKMRFMYINYFGSMSCHVGMFDNFSTRKCEQLRTHYKYVFPMTLEDGMLYALLKMAYLTSIMFVGN